MGLDAEGAITEDPTLMPNFGKTLIRSWSSAPRSGEAVFQDANDYQYFLLGSYSSHTFSLVADIVVDEVIPELPDCLTRIAWKERRLGLDEESIRLAIVTISHN